MRVHTWVHVHLCRRTVFPGVPTLRPPSYFQGVKRLPVRLTMSIPPHSDSGLTLRLPCVHVGPPLKSHVPPRTSPIFLMPEQAGPPPPVFPKGWQVSAHPAQRGNRSNNSGPEKFGPEAKCTPDRRQKPSEVPGGLWRSPEAPGGAQRPPEAQTKPKSLKASILEPHSCLHGLSSH